MFRRPLGPASSLLTLLLLLACPLVVRAADPKPEPKDAEPTGPDYAVQGEYVGEVFTQAGNAPIGVQVVALGKGKFKAVGYLGGLPGDGWDRSPRRASEGGTQGWRRRVQERRVFEHGERRRADDQRGGREDRRPEEDRSREHDLGCCAAGRCRRLVRRFDRRATSRMAR